MEDHGIRLLDSPGCRAASAVIEKADKGVTAPAVSAAFVAGNFGVCASAVLLEFSYLLSRRPLFCSFSLEISCRCCFHDAWPCAACSHLFTSMASVPRSHLHTTLNCR